MIRPFAVTLIAAICISTAPAAAGVCSLSNGESVVLRSSDFDPDVLVWDTRQRAIEYVAGNIKSATEVINHTLLSKPGTHAIVIACDPGSAKPQYGSALDTVGIKLTNGPNRGRYGWVSSGDAHTGATARTSVQ